MSSRNDLRAIKKIMNNYESNMTYWDVYQSKLSNTRNAGVYDSHTSLLDKWLWKYSNYTVSEFIDLVVL